MRIRMMFSSLILCSALGACAQSNVEDDSLYLTGTEEAPVTLANGAPGCASPKKTLICHIPPGNPANAHSICVGNAAVEPHETLHGDTIGACASDPPPCDGTCDDGSDDGGGDDGGGDGGGDGSGSDDPNPV